MPQNLLRWACASLFLGSAWLTYVQGFPSRSLFWDEAMFRPLVERLGMDWQWWVASPEMGEALVKLDFLISTWWILGALALVLMVYLPRKLVIFFVVTGGALLLAQWLLNSKENFWRVGYLVEHAAQVGTPFLLLYAWSVAHPAKMLRWLSILVALTFIGHGLYAVGFHPVPPHFVLMTTEAFDFLRGTNEVAVHSVDLARRALWIVGLLDLVAAIILLLPNQKAKRIALYWIIPWAVLTTLARLWSGAQFGSWATYLSYWIPEFLIRIPHVVLPLLLFLANSRQQPART